jgi:hypothetical protein
MATIVSIDKPAERKLADHVLVLLRGLRLSRDLELAEAAVKAERELTARLGTRSEVDRNPNGKEEPVHA